MSPETLARWQFGITTVYHFFFVPITIALSLLVAVMQTIWVRTGAEKMLQLTKFFGKLFLINFAMGVVTGIVQEFQFGMNWSEYSRFVGDIFGAPLALEALLAFFLESVFLGIWIFGWDRLPKKVHLATIWLAAIGTMISAIFILAANSWMQNPVGAKFNPATDRAEMTDLLAVLTNPVNLITLPHVLVAAYLTAGGLILGVAGWHLAKLGRSGDLSGKQLDQRAAWTWATKFGAWVMIVAGVLSIATGDIQGKIVTAEQPAKMAAAEGLCETTKGAGFSIVAFGIDCSKPGSGFAVTVPGVFSYLGKGDVNAEMQGINDLNKQYAAQGFGTTELQLQAKDRLTQAGVTDFAPSIPVTFWSFRMMIALGGIGILIGLWALLATRKGRLPKGGKLWTAAMIAAPLAPLFANSFGWIMAEMGRQPFIVYGVLPVSAAWSPGVSAFEVGLTMVLYTVIYGALAVVEVRLLLHYIKLGLPDVEEPKVLTDDDAPLSFAY
ncbi:cytochrome bd-I ubiquinol oxidase subunit 1 apoprotein [Propionicimonas paludicola]|uniref:Cytochrome bd-I ubiquinol oxidase subunit 1 apoprotein n=1 Tax=Propionicimonas paludicola TaxID=185243 RepID=A0A2A9CU75_9ACTN|nr:cytochrome ubiquinol oxidase subunit I [Propionicimonas paludicola]PFG17974.1 cytochrome bd-I ubiquinol oxidase subunit 1 apoprotein [Propionicimonas paludicola]